MIRPVRLWAIVLLAVVVRASADEPLVMLDAEKLPDGPLVSWENAGSLRGTFRNDGTEPQVMVVDGVRAVVFDGKDHMTADFRAPAGITGDRPWTCVIRAYSRNLSRERALLAWANRPNNCLELELSETLRYGAVGTWADPNTLDWGAAPPSRGQWHTLVYTYQGGRDSELQAWCDGELRSAKKVTLSTKPDRPFVLGACMYGGDAPAERISYEHLFDGAIASVRVFGRALSPVEIWNASGHDSAFPLSPQRDSILEAVTATLTWMPGHPGVASYDVYIGTEQSAVERAENTLPVGDARDWARVYKGRQAGGNAMARLGPLSLDVGTTYYWRVDQRDASGKVAQRGVVARLTTEAGLATDPVPASGYIFVEGGRKELRWKPGKYAVRQNIYIGQTPQEALAKTRADIADLPATTTAIPLPEVYATLGKDYFWRVESVNRDGLSTGKGSIWSFRIVGRKLKVYLLGGQSNAVGCCSVNGLPDGLRGIQSGAIIFVRGECRLGEYGWASLKEGLGSGFGDYDGRGTFGPELSFGAAMAPASPDRVVAILKCAWGGTNLGVQWRPPSAGGTVGDLYANFIKAVRDGIAALDPAFEPQIAGMIWMQGESDSGDQKMADDYAKNLASLIQDIRTELKSPDLPFVFAQISKAPAWDSPPGRGPQIRAAQLEVSRTVPRTATFATDDYRMCDPWHYDTAGMVSLGERFAKAMKRLENGGEAP